MNEQLIKLVQAHPALYNTKCGVYRDPDAKVRAWEMIAKLLNKPVEDCKGTWTKLRNCYTNAMKRRRIRRRDSGPKKLAPWRYENQMAFLLPFIESHDGSHLTETSVLVDENEFDSDTFDGDHTIDGKQTDIKVFDAFDDHMTPTMSSPKRFKGTHSATNECTTEMMHDDSFKKDDKTLDENDMFFLSMSQTVKRLPKIDQAGIKLKLHQMVYEAEEKMLQNS